MGGERREEYIHIGVRTSTIWEEGEKEVRQGRGIHTHRCTYLNYLGRKVRRKCGRREEYIHIGVRTLTIWGGR